MHTVLLPHNNEKVFIQFNSNNIHIKNSFRITTTREMLKLLKLIRIAAYNRGIVYQRENNSWLREWKAHNVLYKLNIKRDSTKSVDINEGESKGRRFGYFLLSLLYWK